MRVPRGHESEERDELIRRRWAERRYSRDDGYIRVVLLERDGDVHRPVCVIGLYRHRPVHRSSQENPDAEQPIWTLRVFDWIL